MYCPNCGTQASEGRKFCRGCGLGLDFISQALNGQVQSMTTNSLAAKESFFDLGDRKKTRRLGVLTSLGGILLAAMISIIGGALANLDNDLGAFFMSLSGIGGLIFMVGAGLIIYSFFLPKARAGYQPQQQNWLPNEQPHIDMRPDFERRPVGSVTENTTELFDKARNHSHHNQ